MAKSNLWHAQYDYNAAVEALERESYWVNRRGTNRSIGKGFGRSRTKAELAAMKQGVEEARSNLARLEAAAKSKRTTKKKAAG